MIFRILISATWCSTPTSRHWPNHAARVAAADVVMVGSYVPDGIEVGAWVQATARGPVVFYDIDTPVTLAKLHAGTAEYLSAALIPGYGVYFSFTGGPTLDVLERRHGSPAARALYCSVDPDAYHPKDVQPRWDLSYLGTYSADRQPTLERLLIEPARRAPARRFAVAGPQYPKGMDWPANIERIEHVAPAEHPDFYAASRYTLNVTRADMIATGWSPSVRLFEAAACGTPIISDWWDGLETLFDPRTAIRLADDAATVLGILAEPEPDRRAIAAAARQAVLAEHAASHRAIQFESELLLAIQRHHQTPALPSPPRATANLATLPILAENSAEP